MTEALEQQEKIHFPLEKSLAASMRVAHRAMMRELQGRLAPYDIPMSMWYFLRALWEEDGLSQKELSMRAGFMEPTAVEQLRAMQKRGLVSRTRCKSDRRKWRIFLTPTGKELREELLSHAVEIHQIATAGLSEGELGFMRFALAQMSANLAAYSKARSEDAKEASKAHD